jgi:hypothetical protein
MTRVSPLRWRSFAWAVAAATLVSLAVGHLETAGADIGVWSVSRTSGVPGEPVEVLIGCGGCVPGLPGTARVGPRLPVSLLPLRSSLYRGAHRWCVRGTCTPTAPAPPASAPFLPLGVALPLRGGERAPEAAKRLEIRFPNAVPDAVRDHGAGAVRQWLANMNRLRFGIPDAEPGLYKFVIYCRDCVEGREGALIQNPSATPAQRALLREQREEVLRILPASGGRAGSDSNTGAMAWVVGGSLAALAALAVVAFGRSGRPR